MHKIHQVLKRKDFKKSFIWTKDRFFLYKHRPSYRSLKLTCSEFNNLFVVQLQNVVSQVWLVAKSSPGAKMNFFEKIHQSHSIKVALYNIKVEVSYIFANILQKYKKNENFNLRACILGRYLFPKFIFFSFSRWKPFPVKL